MKLLNPLLIIFVCFLLLGCNTISTQPDPLPAEQAASSSDNIDVDWLAIANSASSIDIFINAVDSLIYLEDSDSFKKINYSASVASLNDGSSALGKRTAMSPANQYSYFLDYIGGMCGSINDSYWVLLRTRVSDDRKSGYMDYRIEFDDYNTWCTLQVEQFDGQFKITNYFNHFFSVGQDELVRGFQVLSENEYVEMQPTRKRVKTIYSEMEKGLGALDLYLRDASVDPTLPLVRRLRLALIEGMTDSDTKSKALNYYVKPNGMSKSFPVQQLFLDMISPIDQQQLLRSLESAELATGDKSTLRSLVAFELINSTHHNFAKYLLETALISEPTNTEPYFTLFNWYLAEHDFESAVNILQVLVENFSYEFEREDFLDNETYSDLIEQPVFNEWLPKT